MTINWYPGAASGEGDEFSSTYFSAQENHYLHNGSGFIDIVAGQTLWLQLVTFLGSGANRTFSVGGVSALTWSRIDSWDSGDGKVHAELWYATATTTVPYSGSHSTASRIALPSSSVTEDALSMSWQWEDGYDPVAAIPHLIEGEGDFAYLEEATLGVPVGTGTTAAVPYFVVTIPSIQYNNVGKFTADIDFESSDWSRSFDTPGNGFPYNNNVVWISTAEDGASSPGLVPWIRNQHNGNSEHWHIWSFGPDATYTATPHRPPEPVEVHFDGSEHVIFDVLGSNAVLDGGGP